MATFTASDKFANCFVCSPTNPRGLHLKITTVDGKAHTEIVPEDYMCGLNGLMHGGFSLMLMDEVMYYAVEGYGVDSVTLHSECDFKNPAVIGHKLVAEAWVTKREGKKFYTEGVLKDGDTVIVTATGLYYEMDMSVFLTDDQK